MKNVFLLSLFLLKALSMNAQSFYPYSFSKSNQTYTYLSGATSLTNGNSWDDTVVAAPIGFNFKFLNNTNSSDSVFFSTWGFLAFRNEYYPTPLIWMGRSMVPFAGDLREKSFDIGGPALSNISYQTSGSIGNRIFKLECKNIGFWNDSLLVDSLNFQVWLYETSNVIEYHYGPSNLDSNAWYWQDGGCRIGIYNDVSIDTVAVTYEVNNCSMITGTSATAVNTNISTPYDFFLGDPTHVLTDGPGDDQVFKFAPAINNSIGDVDLWNDIHISSQYSSCILQHKGQVRTAILSDMEGKIIYQIHQPALQQSISTSHLANGMYLLTVYDNKGNSKAYKVIH